MKLQKRFKEPSLPIPQKYKAGFVIVGDAMVDGKPQLQVIAPWVEGAFSTDGKKAYTVAKGTMDQHEDVWSAAKREVLEETGIDLDRIKNPLRNDQPFYNREEGQAKSLYPGVEIETIVRKPIFHGIAPSNRGVPMQQTLFIIKVKGIENLAPFCKHAAHSQPDRLDVTVDAQTLAKQAGLPNFKELLQCLRSGRWDLGNGESVQLFQPVDLGFDIDHIKTSNQLNKAFQSLSDVERAPAKKCLDAIREYMEEQQLINDREGLKIGDKHLPLLYYQEGAEVLPYAQWVQRMVDFAKENPLYRDVQFNNHVVDHKPGREYEGDQSSIGEIALQIGRELDCAQDLHVLRRDGFKNGQVAYGVAVRDYPNLTAQVSELVAQARESRVSSGR